MGISRRDFNIGIVVSASLVASGCAALRRGSELDAAFADLETLLNQVEGKDNRALVGIAEDIHAISRNLLNTNRDFESDFNQKAADRDVTDKSLTMLVREYEVNRTELRSELLQTQDELHAAVPVDAWPDVLDVLNRKNQAIAPTRGMEG
jgi:hypothetical protein